MKSLKIGFLLLIILLLLPVIYLRSYVIFPTIEVSSQEFKIPYLYLDFFSARHKDFLLDYLIKSSEWHVAPINGTVIAVKREHSKTCNPVMLPLPASYPDRKIPYLSANFFNLYPDIAKPSDEYVLENKVYENSQALLKAETTYFEGGHKYENLFLTIESKNKKLSLHIFQPSRDIPSINTTNFLVSTSKELKQLANVTLKGDQYTDSSILPSGSTVIAAHQTVLLNKQTALINTFEEYEPRGEYAVSGYVNPKQKGLIFLRVIDKKTGEPIVSDDPEGTNAEYVGWSSDSTKKFNFCLGASLRATAKDGSQVLSEFQLWFKPSDNSPERILSKQNFLVDVSI